MIAGFRRSHYTLLEIMIVFTILSVIGGLIVINVNKALNEQRFRTEVSLVVDELRLAQDLMLILGTDVHFKVSEGKDSKELLYWLEFDYPLPKQWEHELKRKHKGLRTIHLVDFHDQVTNEHTKGQLDVRFMSGGMVMSRGVMLLSESSENPPPHNALSRYIILPGHPSPIFSQSEKPGQSAYSHNPARESDEQLTHYTRDEIASLQAAQAAPATNPQEKTKDEKKTP